MSAPLSTTGGESQTWRELEDVFAGLSQLARSAVAPQQFYRTVLDESVRALSAVGGAVWLRAANGVMRPVAQIGWPPPELAADDAARRAHDSVLAAAAEAGRVTIVAPGANQIRADAGNLNQHVVLLGPVHVALDGATPAIIEILLRADASPASYRGCEQFLTGVCELAADYHTFGELRRLQQDDAYRTQLLEFGRVAHRQLELSETAYTVANEGRRVIGCDRLSVLVMRGRHCRLLATSGVSRIETRSGAARRLQQIADLVRRTNEPAIYTDGHSDALPPIAEALEQHAEESHARQVAAIPLRPPAERESEESAGLSPPTRSRRSMQPRFVLVAEDFDARDGALARDRVTEVGDVCSTALYNALEFDRLPLVTLLRPLGAAKELLTAHVSRTMFVLVAVAAAIAALFLVPAVFDIEAPGTLQPVVRRNVFAPRSGLVDEVFVSHNTDVIAGQPLVRLRDPSLDLELKRVDGELETAKRQLDAVRSTRTNRAVRDANPADAYRLSAEERELQQRLTNLQRELQLLNHEREQLVVTSPIAGRVLTWEVADRLVARPVERGEVLVTVADLSADWELELDVPDDRIGYVLAAQKELQPNLPVTFRLHSDDREQRTGHIAEICQTAKVQNDQDAAPSPTVLVKIALDKNEMSDVGQRELRPGVSARAQIACGRRPIGYVWFHDIWDAAIEWLRF